jgi:uncharacterized protein (TIGR02466 family)
MREIFDLYPLTLEKTTLDISEKYRLEILSLMKDMKYCISGESDNKVINSTLSESSFVKYVFTHEKLKPLSEKIKECFDKYILDNFHYTNKFVYTTSWFTRTKKNKRSNLHKHSNCMFSGVLYIEVEDDSDAINFTDYSDRNSFFLIPSKYNIRNSKFITIKVKKLDLIFFPSEMHHGIAINQSKKTRYSIAFNFIPIGKIGKGDSEMQVGEI